MSPRVLHTRRTAAPLVGLVAALVLAGCGAGQKAQTYQERAAMDATNDAIGAIAVRNLAIDAPEDGTVLPQGSDAPMTVTFVNEGGQDDVLTSARTDAAASVDVTGPTSSLQLPRLQKADPSYRLVLRDLTRDLQTGTYIRMTLVFERNGSKDLLVPVEVTPEGAPRPSDEYEVPETDSAGKPITRGETAG